MLLPDVNILVCGYREASVDHLRYREWLENLVNGEEPFGFSDIVLSGFLRIVTNPRAFTPPSPIEDALAFIEDLKNLPNCVMISPGARHWEIFTRLCQIGGIRGNLVPDAFLAALAIESGSEWVTMDSDFARFPGLRWRRPF